MRRSVGFKVGEYNDDDDEAELIIVALIGRGNNGKIMVAFSLCLSI